MALSVADALSRMAGTRAAAIPIGSDEYRQRRAAAQQLMAAARIDAMLLPAGASLRYFTGADWHMLERFTGALLPQEGEPAFVAPAFEEPRLTRTLPRDARLLTWQEDQSPFAVCADQLRAWGRCTGTIAIDEACPYFVVRGLAQAAPQAAWTDAALVAGACRQCKSPAEIALIRHAMQTTLEVQRLSREILVEGMATADVVDFLDKAHRAAGADGGSTFAIVAFGAETAHPHGPERPQQLREGDLVLVDAGCQFHGYHADLTRTYVFGAPTPRQREIWELQRAAQQAGFDAIRVGAPCAVVDDAARNVLVRAGLGPDYRTPGLPHRTGHGIGLEIHERPYLVRGNAAPLLQGMCGSIEPTLCIYGEFGVRQEDHFYLTDEGPRWFTEPPEAL